MTTAALTVADKMDMSLDELTALAKAEKKKERAEQLKKKKAEKEATKKATGQEKKSPGKQGENKNRKGDQKQKAKQETSKQDQSKKGGEKKKAEGKEKSNTPKTAAKPALTTGTPVIVSNVDEKVDSGELKDIFETAGPVKSVEIMPARRNLPAAAKITFKLKADAEKAVIEFNNRLLDGKTITVKLTKKRVIAGENTKSSGEGSNGTGNKRQRRSSD